MLLPDRLTACCSISEPRPVCVLWRRFSTLLLNFLPHFVLMAQDTIIWLNMTVQCEVDCTTLH